jgi:acarbose 7IV-phosphotransferase
MTHAPADVLVAGPASWNTLVQLDALPEPRPHTLFARSHHEAVGGTSAGKALNLAALGRPVTLRTVLGADDEADRVRVRLEAAGVQVVVEPAPDGRTEKHLNLMDTNGGRVSVYLQAPGEVSAAGFAWEQTLAALDAASTGRACGARSTTTARRTSTARGARRGRTSSSAPTAWPTTAPS